MALQDDLDKWPVIEPPTEAEIARIRRHAVSLGGAALNLPHNPRQTVFKIQTRRGPGTPQRIALTSCGEIAQFTAPLEEQDWQLKGHVDLSKWQKQANSTRYCVVDDAAHLWPRFQ